MVETDRLAEYKIALGGTPASFLLKDEGGWYNGEDFGVWVRLSAGQAAKAVADGAVPSDTRQGDYARVRVQDPTNQFLTVPADPPFLVKHRSEVVVS